ncbi:hypothetical protein D3C72_1369380 [compost metagenome]
MGAQACSTSAAHSVSSTGWPLRCSCRPLSRPRSAVRCWLCFISAISAGESGGLSDSRQCSRNTSSRRMVCAEMPMLSNGLMSIKRTSTYSTPRSRSACRGRSPRCTVRLGRMVP